MPTISASRLPSIDADCLLFLNRALRRAGLYSVSRLSTSNYLVGEQALTGDLRWPKRCRLVWFPTLIIANWGLSTRQSSHFLGSFET